MGNIAAAVDHILWLNFKGRWIVDLLEIAGKVALVVILPLYQPRDLVSKLGVGNEAACLVHRALVAALQSRGTGVVPESTPLVAGLNLGLAADDVED